MVAEWRGTTGTSLCAPCPKTRSSLERYNLTSHNMIRTERLRGGLEAGKHYAVKLFAANTALLPVSSLVLFLGHLVRNGVWLASDVGKDVLIQATRKTAVQGGGREQ